MMARQLVRPGVIALAFCVVHGAVAHAQNPPGGSARAVVQAGASEPNASALIPAGFGSLRQENIAIKLELPDLIVRITPLDESVIRTLSPDSYRALHDQVESRRPALTRLAAQHGLQRGSVWQVEFFGLAPDARFSPQELTVTAVGRDYRPVEVLPLSSGFGSQRLQPRERQVALYLFDDAVDVNQSLTVSFGTQQSSAWQDILRDVERERAAIGSRASGKSPR
jgi:hypothetical protein